MRIRVVRMLGKPPETPMQADFGENGGTIGRDASCTLSLPDPYKHISRIQAEIAFHSGAFVLTDRGSSNPVIKGGQEVGRNRQALLGDGDTLTLGDFELVVEMSPAPMAVPDVAAPQLEVSATQFWGSLKPQANPNDPFANLLPDQAAVAAPPVSRPASAGLIPEDFDPFAPDAPPDAGSQAVLGPDSGRVQTELDSGLGDPLSPMQGRRIAPSESIDQLFGLGGASANPLSSNTPIADPLAGPNTAGAVDPLVALSRGVPAPSSGPAISDRVPELQGNYFVPNAIGPANPPAVPVGERIPVDPFADLMPPARDPRQPPSGPQVPPVQLTPPAPPPAMPPPVARAPQAAPAPPPAAAPAAVPVQQRVPAAQPPPVVRPIPANNGARTGATPRTPMVTPPAQFSSGGEASSYRSWESPENISRTVTLSRSTPQGPAAPEAPAAPAVQRPIIPLTAPAATPVTTPEQLSSVVDEAMSVHKNEFASFPKTRPTERLAALNQAALSAAMAAAGSSSSPDKEFELLKAFLLGLGLSELPRSLDQGTPGPSQLTPELLRRVGAMLRTSTKGTLDLLAARSMLKREMRTDVTMIVERDNNPLKFSPDATSALVQLLAPKTLRGFMESVPALKDAYNDLLAHQVGFVAGMRAAMQGLIERFDPEKLEGRLTHKTMIESVLPISRKARLWELFNDLYEEISKEAEDDFEALFGKAFVRAYEEQIRRLEQDTDS